MKLNNHKQTKINDATTTATPTIIAKTEMKSMVAAEKKVNKETKKEMKTYKSHHHNKDGATDEKDNNIEPPRLHRDMRLICDCFRISDQSRYALRSFDASTLEDFSLMTDDDFADMVVTHARIGKPIPPLQQRKIRVLLTWVQKLANVENLEVGEEEALVSRNNAEGFELKDSKSDNEVDGILKARYKASLRKGGGTFIPATWEETFYNDLPMLRKQLKRLGDNHSSTSNWANGFLSLRWMFCGYD